MSEATDQEITEAIDLLMKQGEVVVCHIGTTNPLTMDEWRYAVAEDLDFQVYKTPYWAEIRYVDGR